MRLKFIQILSQAVELKNEGKDVPKVKTFVENEFKNSPFEFEYFEITDEETLLSIEHFSDANIFSGFCRCLCRRCTFNR